MTVAETRKAEAPDAELDVRFGRARIFLLHETSTGNWRAVADQNAEPVRPQKTCALRMQMPLLPGNSAKRPVPFSPRGVRV